MKWLGLVCLAAMLGLAADPAILRIASVDEAQIVHKVTPQYPPDALDHRVSGVVKLSVVVGVDGHVQQVKLVSGHALLAPAAMQAARRWVFKPFTSNDQPVRAIAEIEIPFTLPN